MSETNKRNKTEQILMIAAFLQAAFCLLVMMTGVRYVLPQAAGLFVSFVIPQLAGIRSRRAAVALSGVILAGAAVLAVIMYNEILDGICLVMNSLFEASEKTQAYIYEKFEVARDPGTYLECMKYAVLETGIVIGTVLSFIPIKAMRWICGGICVLCAGCFAYFGLLPHAVPAMIMVIALTAVLSGSKLGAVLPVMAAGALIFALVMVISPGENKAVSKLDENLRDKLATSTVSIQGNEQTKSETENKEKNSDNRDGGADRSFLGGGIRNMKVWIVLGLILLTAMILFIPAVIHDRLEKKRKRNRQGIDSIDPKAAVCAMFPYAVKWLKEAGLETGNVPFADLAENVRKITTDEYAREYSAMLIKWKEAAYSDYDLGEDDRSAMKGFMERTIADVKEKMSFKDKMRVRFVTAL